MDAIKKVKFTGHNNSLFNKTLKKRLDDYFAQHQQTHFADGRMWFKVVFWLGMWIATWCMAMFFKIPGWALLIVAIAHMFTHLCIAFNIAHDANHDAISKKKWVNHLLGYSLDLCGVNSYLWRYSHNNIHHSYVNIEGIDTSSEGHGIIRFTTNAEWKPIYKYQHLYAPFLYGIATLNYVFSKDFWIFLHLRKNQHGLKPSVKQWFFLIVTKMFYYTYTLIIPTLLLPYSFWTILLVFVLCHAILGIALALTFQTGHLIEETSFPAINADGNIDKNWAIHIVETTVDYARTNPVVAWFLGSINVHVIHHLYPRICHTHYADIAPIVQQTAEEHGLQYRTFPSFGKAIASHFKLLKQLGEKP